MAEVYQNMEQFNSDSLTTEIGRFISKNKRDTKLLKEKLKGLRELEEKIEERLNSMISVRAEYYCISKHELSIILCVNMIENYLRMFIDSTLRFDKHSEDFVYYIGQKLKVTYFCYNPYL